jgi:hypothetical protein
MKMLKVGNDVGASVLEEWPLLGEYVIPNVR